MININMPHHEHELLGRVSASSQKSGDGTTSRLPYLLKAASRLPSWTNLITKVFTIRLPSTVLMAERERSGNGLVIQAHVRHRGYHIGKTGHSSPCSLDRLGLALKSHTYPERLRAF